MLVRKGTLRVDIETDDGPASHLLQSGEAIDIPRLVRHRLTPDEDGTEVIEFSTHHRDDDSYRTDHGASRDRRGRAAVAATVTDAPCRRREARACGFLSSRP